MNYSKEEWDRIDEAIRRQNIAFNIKVIRMLWKLKYNGYGVRSGFDLYDNTNLYCSLGRSYETLRQWEMHEIRLNEKRIFEWARKVENRTGIPGEYLSGQEMIDISCVSTLKAIHYEKYYERYIALEDMITELKNHEIKGFENEKTENLPSNNKKMTLKEMEECINKLSSKNKDKVIEILDEAKKHLDIVKEYNEELMGDLQKLLVTDFEIRLKNNYNLRKLIYYIYWGESANTGECIVDLIRIMKKKHVKELQDAGEELLFDYINALKEQLHLAQSVYIVASDNGEFCNKRNMKKIFD